jgi:hypothetical protein
LSLFAGKSPAEAGSPLPGEETRPLLLPGFLPKQPRVEELRLLAERLAGEVDVALRRLEVGWRNRARARCVETVILVGT